MSDPRTIDFGKLSPDTIRRMEEESQACGLRLHHARTLVLVLDGKVGGTR